jgi:hypothetical protein
MMDSLPNAHGCPTSSQHRWRRVSLSS